MINQGLIEAQRERQAIGGGTDDAVEMEFDDYILNFQLWELG